MYGYQRDFRFDPGNTIGMIKPADFYSALLNVGVEYFTGVPDSLLKSICAYITEHAPSEQHVIAANEGGAMGLAIGTHLATGSVPLVYMQNSGLGNIVNPLLSLVDPDVYATPMLLMIGWRGEPGVKDEPQHIKQGAITTDMLEAMSVPYLVVDSECSNINDLLAEAVAKAKETSGAVALLIKKGSFEPYSVSNKAEEVFLLSREDAISSVLDCLLDDDIVVATTGMASRELFEYRARHAQGHQRDFLTVGGMGHASQIALGIAAQKKDRRVVCIDGDGAALMHLGALAINGQSGLSNFHHLVINNAAHDSVGGQPTLGFAVHLPRIAESMGYNVVASTNEHKHDIQKLLSDQGPSFLEVKVDKGNRSDLGRPTLTPKQNKDNFMRFLAE